MTYSGYSRQRRSSTSARRHGSLGPRSHRGTQSAKLDQWPVVGQLRIVKKFASKFSVIYSRYSVRDARVHWLDDTKVWATHMYSLFTTPLHSEYFLCPILELWFSAPTMIVNSCCFVLKHLLSFSLKCTCLERKRRYFREFFELTFLGDFSGSSSNSILIWCCCRRVSLKHDCLQR